MTLPAKFVERVLRDLGGTEGAALCAALDAEPPVSVRLNPAKTGADTLPAGPDAGLPVPEAAGLPALAIAGRVPWSRDGRYLAVRPSFTLDPDFHAGAYYVQEASSQFVGHLLAAVRTEGARILDLCAAPGGKTTLYASLAGPDGLVVANEIDRRRASVLADNVRKWGTGNVAVTTCEPRALGDFEAWFDVVAVDAPCSGEGMFRKDPDARGEWSEGNVKQCAAPSACVHGPRRRTTCGPRRRRTLRRRSGGDRTGTCGTLRHARKRCPTHLPQPFLPTRRSRRRPTPPSAPARLRPRRG